MEEGYLRIELIKEYKKNKKEVDFLRKGGLIMSAISMAIGIYVTAAGLSLNETELGPMITTLAGMLCLFGSTELGLTINEVGLKESNDYATKIEELESQTK